MRIAVFGGSGFLGYDFVRLALRRGGVEPVVYSSGTGSVANLARHGIDLRFYSPADLESVVLDADTDTVVNFAHPFERGSRGGGDEQIRRFVRFISNAKRANPSLRLVHLSSMAVYEPFTESHAPVETDPLRPPRDDRYAQEKVLAETMLLQLPDAGRWQLHLRPTIVYGPFCRPFTDRFFEAFRQGDVGYLALSGRIQPIFGADISRFIYDRLFKFTTGVYNLPGPEEMSWHAFVKTFRDIVDVGRLVLMPEGQAGSGPKTSYKDDLRRLMLAVRREPAFERMATRLTRRLPGAAAHKAKAFLLGPGDSGTVTTVESRTENTALLGRPYFAQNRLVSDAKFRREFPEERLSRVSDVTPVLEKYYRFRFSDCRIA